MEILVITHAQDRLVDRPESGGADSQYMLGPVLEQLVRMGHRVGVCRGLPAGEVAADLAILHVDLTFVPPDYAEFAGTFPRCVNLRALDLSKRRVSGAVLAPDAAWEGPVIVKSDWNDRGRPELGINQAAAAAGEPEPFPGLRRVGYSLYDRLADVPAELADDPNLVIERFIPERAERGFAVRFWTFAGAAERCSRVFSNEPVVKAANQTGFELCPVPDALRRRRDELGFDFGKFDFVMEGGEPVLIDANRTPGVPPIAPHMTWPRDYAEGLMALAG